MKIKFWVITAVCLSAFVAQAQDKLLLSLEGAVSYAVEHNKTLENSKLALDKSQQKIRETIAQGLPQINASVDYTNFLGAEAELKLNPMAPPAVIEFNPTSNFKLTAAQLVFNGAYFVGIEIAKLANALSEQGYQKDVVNVKEQAIQAYYLILANERILKMVKENKANADLIYEKTQNLANAGMIEQTDAKKLSVMVNSVANVLRSTERQLEMSYNLLRLHLGLEPEQQVQLTTGLDEVVSKYIEQSAIQGSFEITNNGDYKLVSMQCDLANKQIKLRKAAYLPSVTAFYSYTEKLKKPLFDMTPKNVLGFTLNIPIFSGGQRYYQLSQAVVDLKVMQNTRELLVQQLTMQEKQLRYNYNNLLDQYLNQKENIKIAKEVLDKMNLKFQLGVVSSLELTSANNDYLTAETNMTAIMLQLLNAELSLRKINFKI